MEVDIEKLFTLHRTIELMRRLYMVEVNIEWRLGGNSQSDGQKNLNNNQLFPSDTYSSMLTRASNVAANGH